TYAFEKLDREPIFAAQRGNVILSGMNAPGNAGTSRPTWGFDTALMDGGYNDYYWLGADGQLVYGSDTAALENTCRTMGGNSFPMYGSSEDDAPYTCGNAHYYDGDTISTQLDKISGYVSGHYRFTD